MTFSAVILAGGQSSRMGRDKAWLEVNGQTLLARQIQLVREAGATEVFVSGRADQDYSSSGITVLMDRYPSAGPLAGIERGLESAQHSLVLVMAVDMAGMTVDCLRWLLTQCREGQGIVPQLGGRLEPLAAVYPQRAHVLAVSLLEAARPGGNAPGPKDLAQACVSAGLARHVEAGSERAGCFANWNTPADVPLPESCRGSKDRPA